MRSFAGGLVRVVSGVAIGFAAASVLAVRRRRQDAAEAGSLAAQQQQKLRAGLRALREAQAANERLQVLVAERQAQVDAPAGGRDGGEMAAGPAQAAEVARSNGIPAGAAYMRVLVRGVWVGPFGLN